MTTRFPHLRACSAAVAVAAATSLAAVPSVDAKEYVSCRDGQSAATVRGSFTGRDSGRQTRLFLAPDADRGCVVRHERGDAADIGQVADGAHIAAICRDAETGRDHAIVHSSAGQHSDIQVWAVDPATGSPLMRHSEAWGDSVYPAGEDWGVDLFVAADGACRWRERQDAHQSFEAAMAALRIGVGVDAATPEFDLPTRPVPAETVRRWLPALKDAVTLEGAEYADDAGRKSWFVVQILGTTLCDAEGVVLLFDRRRQSWRTIYDVPSGCTKVLNNPMRRMVVKGDRLLASICSECDGWGYLYQYRDYVVNLRTFRATVLDPEDGLMLPEDQENPMLHEFDVDVLLRSGP